MIAVGLMSGTSLDGIDAALVEIEGAGLDTKVNLLAFNTYEIPLETKKRIKIACLDQNSSTALICSLNFELGKLFSDAVGKILRQGQMTAEALDFVASHGQTIYHLPEGSDLYLPSTLQIGEPSIIAYEHGVQVISNFRTMDLAAGGAGAPLVPYSEYILYGGRGENIALQNIGGIGNVTLIPAEKDIRKIFAFDTGPGNMMIDEACQQLFGLAYDANGDIAKKGKVIESLLEALKNHPYLALKPPKTTGREVFGQQFVDRLLAQYSSEKPEDVVCTLTYYTAFSIAQSYKDFVFNQMPIHKVIVGGGGAHNQFLMETLQGLIGDIPVYSQDDLGYSADAKEAIAFVILGNETLHGNPSNVMTATGAKASVVLGNITPAP